jgi:hypothetical protein
MPTLPRQRRPRPAVVVAVTLLAAVAVACPSLDEPSSTATTTTTTWPRGDRHSELDVDDGMEPSDVAFADADHGYALLSDRTIDRASSALFRTDDGGRSWQRMPFDSGGRDAYSLTVRSESLLAVSVEKGYLVSRDGARTFTPAPSQPDDFMPFDRKAGIRCAQRSQDEDSTSCLRWEVAKAERSVPQQPPLRDDVEAAAEDAEGRIWAVAFAQDAVFTAISTDAGTSWQALPDLRLPVRIDQLRLVASHDGTEMWMIADGFDDSLTVHVAEGTTWRPVTERLQPGFEADEITPAGGGVLLLAGTGEKAGAGYLDRSGAWRRLEAPRDVANVLRLADGTLAATPKAAENGVWLGVGQGADRAWVHVTVAPA